MRAIHVVEQEVAMCPMCIELRLQIRRRQVHMRDDAVQKASRLRQVGDHLQPAGLGERVAAVEPGLDMDHLGHVRRSGLGDEVLGQVVPAD